MFCPQSFLIDYSSSELSEFTQCYLFYFFLALHSWQSECGLTTFMTSRRKHFFFFTESDQLFINLFPQIVQLNGSVGRNGTLTRPVPDRLGNRLKDLRGLKFFTRIHERRNRHTEESNYFHWLSIKYAIRAKDSCCAPQHRRKPNWAWWSGLGQQVCLALYWQQMNNFSYGCNDAEANSTGGRTIKINCICIATIANVALGFKVEADGDGKWTFPAPTRYRKVFQRSFTFTNSHPQRGCQSHCVNYFERSAWFR